MGEDAKSAKTQVLIAVIGLVGVLGTAVITNWDKFSRHGEKPTPITKTSRPTIADAERLTANYLDAYQKGEPNSIVGMISVPFFFKQTSL